VRPAASARAALLAAAVLAAAPAAARPPAATPPPARLAQVEDGVRRTRVLGRSPDAAAALTFDLLLERHLRYQLGGLDRLPAAATEDPVRPGVYFTITTAEVALFERPVLRLERGLLRGAMVTGCLPAGQDPAASRPVRCAPAVRPLAVRALREEAGRLRGRGLTAAPTVLLITDRDAAFAAVLHVAYAAALGTTGAPPELGLVVRTRRGPGLVPVHLVPPRPVRIAAGALPLLATVHVAAGGGLTLQAGGRGPRAAADLAALEALAAELKGREPDRTVVFVTADPRARMAEVVAAVGRLRPFFPHVVLGAAPPALARRGASD
jgi:hypothetical protein